MKTFILVCTLLFLGACDGGGDAGDAGDAGGGAETREHVWSEQVNTINRARGVEDVLGVANERQRQQIDEQMQ